ncbi:MAG TPA: lamin tail domain-containing protein [Thermoleophilaceae bacterium]|nr:lamin tail domain-containing protein [Thermoleophilaceae bacterium]
MTRALGLAAVLTSLLVAAPAAEAARAPCVPGKKKPKCKVWTAKVKYVADGDTLRPQVKTPGGKYTKKGAVTVRMLGLQAPELSHYTRVGKGRRGNCLGPQAANTLDKLIKGKFRLVALRGSSVTQGKRVRLRRALQVRKGGRWVDPAVTLLEKGLALWFPNGNEWPWNKGYFKATEKAQKRGAGLFNPTACGKPGPSQDAKLRMKIRWDGEGTDKPGGEWIRIHNESSKEVSLKGWNLRDSHLRGRKLKSGYRFPKNAKIPANGAIRVVVGKGKNDANTFHWGEPHTIFDNVSGDKKWLGDGAYLFDPNSELRAWQMYPCKKTCSEPYNGDINLAVTNNGSTDEWVTLTNRGSDTINLYEYEIENQPFYFEFPRGSFLRPGSSAVLFVHKKPGGVFPGRGPFRGVVSFYEWGKPGGRGLFSSTADLVVLRNPNGAPVKGACKAWGRFRCPNF